MTDYKINYEYPYFENYVEPKGALTVDARSHACFYYLMLALKARAIAGHGIEGQIIEYKVGETPPEWMESRDEELARSVAIVYGLKDPDEFLRFRSNAWAQAVGLGIDGRVAEDILKVSPGRKGLIH